MVCGALHVEGEASSNSKFVNSIKFELLLIFKVGAVGVVKAAMQLEDTEPVTQEDTEVVMAGATDTAKVIHIKHCFIYFFTRTCLFLSYVNLMVFYF